MTLYLGHLIGEDLHRSSPACTNWLMHRLYSEGTNWLLMVLPAMFNRCTILYTRIIPQHIILNKNHIVEICFYKYLVIQGPIPKGMNQ